jgi:hypothetical protein
MGLLTTYTEVALQAGFGSTTPTWTDVTGYVRNEPGISLEHWRDKEDTETQPSRCTLTLINNDGRFTPDKTGGAYYPNIRRGRPVRVRCRDMSVNGNMLSANAASFETSVADWESNTVFGTFTAATSWVRSTTRAQNGSASLLATWPTTGIGSWVDTIVSGFVIGRTYTVSAYVWVPTGSPDPNIHIAFVGNGSATSTKDAWVRISHTFVALSDTHFCGVRVASATSGQTCYVDAVQIDEGGLRTFTTTAPVHYPRFTGFADSWEVDWPAVVGGVSDCVLSASSRMTRLGRGSELRSIIEEEIDLDSPDAYYTFGDPAGSTAAKEASGGTSMTIADWDPSASGNNPAFGSAIGPPTDSLTGVTMPSAGGKYLQAILPTAVGGTETSVLLETFVNTPGGIQQDIAEIRSKTTNSDGLFLGSGVTGNQLYGRFRNGATIVELDAGSSIANAVHHVALRATNAAGTTTVKLYLDGVEIDSATTGAAIPSLTVLSAGASVGSGLGNPLGGSLFHLAMFGGAEVSATRIAAHSEAGATGFANEEADNRLARYAGYLGIPASELDLLGHVHVTHFDITGLTAIDAMRRVETTEGGVLYDALDGKLALRPRDARYGTAAAFTLSYSSGQIAGSLQPVLDDQEQVNDVTVTNIGEPVVGTGSGLSVRRVDQASIDANGYYREEVELASIDATEPEQRAGWIIYRYAEPPLRVASLPVLLNVLDSTLTAAILTAQIGARVTLTNLPSNAPSSTMDLFVEGINETITAAEHRITFRTSPGRLYDVFVLGTSLLDSDDMIAY